MKRVTLIMFVVSILSLMGLTGAYTQNGKPYKAKNSQNDRPATADYSAENSNYATAIKPLFPRPSYAEVEELLESGAGTRND